MASSSENTRLTDANLQIILDNREGEDKPWTKKAACEFLGISYNTARLDSLLEKYIERKEYTARKKKENKGKPASEQEVICTIESYLEGRSIDEISKGLFRGTQFVKNILINHGVTFRPTAHDYFKPELIPETAMLERFEIGEIAYSTQYNANVEIRLELANVNGYVYRVWVLGTHCKFAYVSAHELSSLRHIKALGVAI